jgi:hypothetical protein
MLKLLACAVALALPAAAPAAELAAEPARVDVMVLGTFHLSNPGRDLNNAKVDDVLTPRKQIELQAVAERLARFKPTKVVIERQADGPEFKVAGYDRFTSAALLKDRNEDTQIGYRLAAMLGHKAVYGFDEQPGTGEPDYFPFDKVQAYATAHDKADWLNGLFANVRSHIKRFEAAQATSTMSELLAQTNDPGDIAHLHRTGYYEMLKLGDGEAQPGADLNAMWYLRNAKMFGKLTNIAEPGDRLLVVVGSGHAYWLRHLVSETPGYRLVDPVPYLKAE